MKDYFFLVVGIAVITWSFYSFFTRPSHLAVEPPSGLKIGDFVIPVEVADTDSERNRGLSGREALAEDTGLLFIFENSGIHGFWMKDMNFAIDIVWIDESWQVAGVEREVGPETFPKVFYPNRAIKYVLELPASNAARFGIDTGVRLSSDQ